MEQRRLAKRNVALYNLLDSEIRQDCRTEKETMLTEQCQVIEQLDAVHKSNFMHSRIKLVTGRKRGNNTTIFVEIDKPCVGTTRHIIVGCVYRLPWFDLSQFYELLNKTLDLLNKNHYVFLLGDFNVDLTQGVETNLAMEEFKNTFSTHYFFYLSRPRY